MQLKHNINEILAKAKGNLFDRQFMDRLGAKMVDIIYKRTKTGKGVRNSKQIDLAALKDSYIAMRRGIRIGVNGKKSKKRNPPIITGDYFSPARSNLTMTGQMLSALSFKVMGATIDVYVQNDPRITAWGLPDSKTNADVAKIVSKRRPFMGLTEGEQRILQSFIKAHIIETIKSMIK